MQNINEKVTEEEFECLPSTAWVFLGVAVIPHVLMLAGQQVLASIAACSCFPITMGPLAVAHTALVTNRLGFISHMSWMSALIFSQIWFAFFCWSWRKNRRTTLAICAPCIIVSAILVWLRVTPTA